ncbi:hypothetical protein FB451DRAFT_681244 [Mycena latifolia]|nr:hypothetical protein FB451DRAFT_681244 [Mycena latifolia]
MRRDIHSRTEKPAQPFENGNASDVPSEDHSGEEILPVFGPPLKSSSAASNRPSVSRERPHSPRISSPLGRTAHKGELTSASGNMPSVASIRTPDDLHSLRKHEFNLPFLDAALPLHEESSGEEEIVLECFQAFRLPTNTPQGRTPFPGHHPETSAQRSLLASPSIASPSPTLVHCPRPLKRWEQSDVHFEDSGRAQGYASPPRKPPARGHVPFECTRSGGRVSPKTLVGQGLWQQAIRRSPRSWADRRPVSPTPPFTRLHYTQQGTPRPSSNLAQLPISQSAADRMQVQDLERMSSGEETFYGVSAGRQYFSSSDTFLGRFPLRHS